MVDVQEMAEIKRAAARVVDEPALFSFLFDYLTRSTIDELLSTKLSEKEAREALYRKTLAISDLKATISNLATLKD
jgi:hypothetical protein